MQVETDALHDRQFLKAFAGISKAEKRVSTLAEELQKYGSMAAPASDSHTATMDQLHTFIKEAQQFADGSREPNLFKQPHSTMKAQTKEGQPGAAAADLAEQSDIVSFDELAKEAIEAGVSQEWIDGLIQRGSQVADLRNLMKMHAKGGAADGNPLASGQQSGSRRSSAADVLDQRGGAGGAGRGGGRGAIQDELRQMVSSAQDLIARH